MAFPLSAQNEAFTSVGRRLVVLAILVLTAMLGACSVGDCPEDSTASWTDVEPLFTQHCISCHSSELEGDDRLGAPEGYDYNSHEEAGAHPGWTWTEVKLGHMPPSEPLDESAQQLIREWLACGAL